MHEVQAVEKTAEKDAQETIAEPRNTLKEGENRYQMELQQYIFPSSVGYGSAEVAYCR